MNLLFDYLKITLFSFTAIVLLRLLEITLIISNFGLQESLIASESLGLFIDLLTAQALLLIACPVYYAISLFSKWLANTVFILILSILTILGFFILQYFAYQLLPLDIFLYKHTFQEIQLTVKTAPISILNVLFVLLILLSLLFLSFWHFNKRQYSKRVIITAYSAGLVLLIGFACIQFSNSIEYDLFSLNKSRYFYYKSFSYFMKGEESQYSERDGLAFQHLHPSHSYVNIKYPLLHTFKNDDVLGPFFNKFESAPNIVVLVVEGLNDDFIHPYHGINLMPYLSKLKDESLYWNRCFTLGERSFAVMPCLTGSLPYSEGGFMQSAVMPRHLSFIPILQANDYYTTFFYGQGRWFHNKGEYFERNHIDLIVDNTSFPEKYKKIIVGDDNFFWGYNDKDLFRQSLETMQTQSTQKRLAIYFTGTSHAPFVIADTAYYENKFAELVKNLKTKDDVLFFETYKKKLITELFVNDALEEFMNEYRKRQDFENTLFIITGDHPMTEVPRGNELKKYHVPLLIYSPKLKSPHLFSQKVSHLDIYESLLSFLMPYKITVPSISSAIGEKLNTSNRNEDKKIAFMNGNREIVDYLSNNYFLCGQQLYRVNDDLSLTKSSDKFRESQLQEELRTFNKLNLQVCRNDKIISDSLYCQSLSYQLIHSQKKDSLFVVLEDQDFVKTELPNEEFYVDISFSSPSISNGDLSVIYELKNKKGETFIWQNNGIDPSTKLFKLYTKIPKQTTADTPLDFKVFFHNSKKEKVKLHDLRVLIYRK